MRTFLTAQQIAFFAQNGYIELEGILPVQNQVFSLARSVLETRAGCALSRVPSPRLYLLGRDLWREQADLQTILLKQLSKVALSLTGKPLRLACDQWIPSEYVLAPLCSLKEIFSIQGLALAAILCPKEIIPSAKTSLGLLPLPKNPNGILFFKPELLIDWPGLAKIASAELYCVVYPRSTAVYIHNSNDPTGNALKQMGYHFGDPLQNHLHPIIFPS